MNHQHKRDIVDRYVAAYNAFDIEGMLRELHEAVVFNNQSGGVTTHQTTGIAAFRAQAEAALTMFSERRQQILGYREPADGGGAEISIEIAYTATLANDLPNGMKAGEVLRLRGWSDFRFQDGKIIAITDRS